MSIISLNECSNFRSKSIGEMPKEQTSKFKRYEESTQCQYPRHRSKEQIKPYKPTEILNALMLQPHDQRRCNTLVNIKLS